MAASMQSLALMLGPLGGGFVTGQAGIEAVYVVIGVVLVLAGVAAFLFVKEPKEFGRNYSRPAR
jgi:MFS family permease